MNPKINPTSPEAVAQFLEQAANLAERGPSVRWFAREAIRLVRALQGEAEEAREQAHALRKERDNLRIALDTGARALARLKNENDHG